tara:strand:- start:568 stop:855 length:288 start_codon:yes stop_codon:yes gene_type:complete
MKLETAKLGERGQVTIPLEFRKELNLEQGETIVFTRDEDRIILKSTKNIKSLERLREDLIDSKIADRRLKEMEKGEVVTQPMDEFLKDLEKWAKE